MTGLNHTTNTERKTMSEKDVNNIRAVGLEWQQYMVAVATPADVSSPPILEERWISLKAFISYYLARGWKF